MASQKLKIRWNRNRLTFAHQAKNDSILKTLHETDADVLVLTETNPCIDLGNVLLCDRRKKSMHFPIAACLAFSLALALNSAALTAQQQAAPQEQPAGPELLELPVLVTDHEHRPVDDVKADQFKVKIDAATPISPVAVRREMNDPITLTILIDASRDSFRDLGQVGDDLAAISATSFLPGDRVNMYAIDCTVARSLSNALPDAATLRKGVTDAITYQKLHDGKSSSACGKTVRLWDDVAIAISALSHMPGRRVLLLISSGEDGNSKYDWKTVQQFAVDSSVAVFSLRDQRQMDADTDRPSALSVHRGFNGPSNLPIREVRSVTDLELLSANAGGLTLSANPLFRKDAIADILFLVRSRFILSIPKDAYAAGASHTVKASLPLLKPYFVSTTGAAPPLTTP